MAARKASVTTMMGPAPDVASFLELLSELPDPRVERTRLYELPSILFLCLCAVICGANDLVTIERFGKGPRMNNRIGSVGLFGDPGVPCALRV
jgi:hypothetical protein